MTQLVLSMLSVRSSQLSKLVCLCCFLDVSLICYVLMHRLVRRDMLFFCGEDVWLPAVKFIELRLSVHETPLRCLRRVTCDSGWLVLLRLRTLAADVPIRSTLFHRNWLVLLFLLLANPLLQKTPLPVDML